MPATTEGARPRPPAVGLVGCGNWGRNILRDLVTLGSSVTVVDRSTRGATNAREGGAVAIVERLGNLPDVAGVVVAVPAEAHAGVVEALLPRKVPIFVEKPLTNDPAAADRIVELGGDRVFVMDKWRYHPGVECLAAMVRSGELGPAIGLETVRVGWGNPHPDVDGIWVLAPHDLSISLEVLGEIPTPRAAAADRTPAGAAGLIGMLGHDPWFRLEVGTRSGGRRREVILRCRDGVATLSDGWDSHVDVMVGHGMDGAEPVVERRAISSELPLLRELKAFLHYLEGGPPPRSTAAEGAWVVRTISELRALAGLSG